MCRISSRPTTSGRSTVIWRSKRPGRKSAGSSTSGRLVAAITITPCCDSKPSISASSWLRVCSRSSCAPMAPAPARRPPMASSSSMKMMLGAAFLACSNRSRTRDAPTPTNISTNSEALTEKNGAPASPAVALASSVLPVPGEPTKMTPLVILPPSRWKRAGSLRYSVISRNSPTASPAPPTFSKVTPVCSPWMTRALLLPKEKMPPGPPAPPAAPRMLLNTKYPKTPNRTSGSTQPSAARMPPLLATWPVAFTLLASRSLSKSGSSTRTVW